MMTSSSVSVELVLRLVAVHVTSVVELSVNSATDSVLRDDHVIIQDAGTIVS